MEQPMQVLGGIDFGRLGSSNDSEVQHLSGMTLSQEVKTTIIRQLCMYTTHQLAP
jgi:hypothetical protein